MNMDMDATEERLAHEMFRSGSLVNYNNVYRTFPESVKDLLSADNFNRFKDYSDTRKKEALDLLIVWAKRQLRNLNHNSPVNISTDRVITTN